MICMHCDNQPLRGESLESPGLRTESENTSRKSIQSAKVPIITPPAGHAHDENRRIPIIFR